MSETYPGTQTIFLAAHHSITSGSITGVMMNSDPASIAFSASSGLRIVPL